MKKTVLAIATFAALSGSAIAADLPRKAPAVAPAPLPVATWTGCYLTGGVGYGMWNQDNHAFDPATGLAEVERTNGGRGWLGRVGGGCDYQFWQRWVVGVLADYDFASLKGDMTTTVFTGEEKNNRSWAVGGRLGYLPWDTLLTFVSGGYTEAKFQGVNFVAFDGTPSTLSIADRKYPGWFLGGGYEYRFDWLPGLYWKTEYRFSSLNKKDNQVLDAGVPNGLFVHSEKFIQTVTSSLVWRFNWWR